MAADARRRADELKDASRKAFKTYVAFRGFRYKRDDGRSWNHGWKDATTYWANLLFRAEKEKADAVAQAVKERDEEIICLLDGWIAAYPLEAFPLFVAADHPHVSPDRIGAEMARHMARQLKEQIRGR